MIILLVSLNPIITFVSHVTAMDDQEINFDGEEENDTSEEEKEVELEKDEKNITFSIAQFTNEQYEVEIKKQWAHNQLNHQKIDLEVPFLPPKL